MTKHPVTPPPTPAARDGDRRHGPIGPTVVYIALQADDYRLPPLQRVADGSRQPVQLHAPGASLTTERGHPTIDQCQGWYLPDAAAWLALCAAHAAAQHTLDALAMVLRRLGRYDRRLAAAGGVATAPNPLTPTVIAALDPDAPTRGTGALAAVPQFVRCPVAAHTPKLLRVQVWGTRWSRSAQHQFFVCPSDEEWHTLRVAQQAVSTARGAFRNTLAALRRSSDALADGRATPGLRNGAGSGNPT